MFLLISQPMKHLNSLDRSYIFTESIAFWYMISKKCQNHSVIFHLWRLWRCIIEEIWKIHWKSTIKKTQCCFANISPAKAPIFTKFYMVVNYYLVSLCIKFHEDPCINARAGVVNARSRDKTCARAFTTRARAFMHGSSWNLKQKLTR